MADKVVDRSAIQRWIAERSTTIGVAHEPSPDTLISDKKVRMEPNDPTSPLRLLLIAPRVWPQSGDVEIFTLNLAHELLQLGTKPLVLSCKWSPVWPEQIVVREVPITRLHQAPKGGWSSFRYMTELSRWLRQARGRFDAVYVLGMRQEAYAAVGALASTNIPVAVRCHDTGTFGDCAWHQLVRFGDRFRRRCQQAQAIVASGADAQRELIAASFDPATIVVLPAAATLGTKRTPEARFRARSELAEANHDLSVAEYAPVFLWIGRLADARALFPLLDCWRDIAARWPSARMWLIGDGPAREKIFSRIVELELRYQVFMPGTFEDIADLLTAADVFISTEPQAARQTICESIAAGLVVVAAEGSDMDAAITQADGILVPRDDRTAWTAALSRFCESPSVGSGLLKMGQESKSPFSLRRTAIEHLELFKRLASR